MQAYYEEDTAEVCNTASLQKVERSRLHAESKAAREKNAAEAFEDASSCPRRSLVESQLKRNFAGMMSGMTPQQVNATITKDNFDLYRERGFFKAERALWVNFAVSQITVPVETKLRRSILRGRRRVDKS